MKRFIDADLKAWKENPRRKPLIVRGARQVGKTYSIRQFGEKEFENLVYVNLERNADLRHVFQGNLDSKKIAADIEIITGQRIVPGKTLLFFDELQACPSAITALRYFYEETPDLHVISAGSLLEFAMKDLSFPVGRVQFLHLFPLAFAEYLAAIGRDEASHLILGKPQSVSVTVHNFLIDELRRYFFIGGMPESIKAFIDTSSMRESFLVQAEIAETYRLDFGKYSPRVDKHCLDAVLTSVARSAGQQTKYSKLADGYSNPTIKKAYEALCLAGLLRKISSTDPSGLPLGARASAKIFKSVMVDIGLMRHLTGMPLEVEYTVPNLLNIYRGAMAEQFTGQEMAVSQKGDLFYWARNAPASTAEVDYLAVVEGTIFPVEVKSGPSGRLKSMHLFLQSYTESGNGMVFSSNPFGEIAEERLRFLPLYFSYSATGGTGSLNG